MVIKPEIINGLTLAETYQLAADHIRQGTVTDEIVRFYGIHIDMIEDLNGQIKAYRAEETQHGVRQTSYNELLSWANRPDEIKQVALRAAGVAVMHSKHALRDSHEKTSEQGTQLSLAAVDFFRNRLPDYKEILIAGLPYSLEHAVLTSVRSVGKKVLTFAHGEHFSTVARKVYSKDGVSANHADIQDWQTLLAGLELVSKF